MAKEESGIERAARLIGRAGRIYVLTSDGLSQDSGLAPLMDETKLWQGHKPSWLARRATFEKHPDLVWGWYCHRRQVVARHRPSAVHHALAEWEALYGRLVLVTDSVDGLHREAGQEGLNEILGSIWHNKCTACRTVRVSRTQVYEGLPHSPCCRKLERPGVLWVDDEERRMRSFFSGPTSRRMEELGIFIGADVVTQVELRCYFAWQWTIEIHEDAQAVKDALFLRGPPRAIVPQLFRMAAAFKR